MKLYSIVANYGQSKALADNQKWKPGCPWDNYCFFLDTDWQISFVLT